MSKQYGIFYRSNGRITKTPYLGEVYTDKTIGGYFKNCAEGDKKRLKTKLFVRQLRNGKRH